MKNSSIIEKVIREIGESIVTFNELKHRIGDKLDDTEIKSILANLESKNKIVVSEKGITWIHNPTLLKKILSEETKRDIEEAREQIKRGETITLEEIKKKLNI